MQFTLLPNRQLSLSAASAVICFVVFMIIDTLFTGAFPGSSGSLLPAISASIAVGVVTYFLSKSNNPE